ncbi:hypothetical protein FKM82_019262 [Ascaphus truei]
MNLPYNSIALINAALGLQCVMINLQHGFLRGTWIYVCKSITQNISDGKKSYYECVPLFHRRFTVCLHVVQALKGQSHRADTQRNTIILSAS